MRPSAPESLRKAVLDQPRPGSLTIAYTPDADRPPTENPPRFSWLPDIDDASHYVLEVSTSAEFEPAATRRYPGLAWNFFTPDETFAPGTYCWRYALWDEAEGVPGSEWSAERFFIQAEGLPETPVPSPAQRRGRVRAAHPRLWLDETELAAFGARVATHPPNCGRAIFFAKSVAPWMDRPIIAEPKPYPDNVRVASLWRQMYIDCQEVIYAIRHLAIAGRVLGDTRLLDRAREWLLAVAAWDTKGPTSRAYNDEAAFRVVVALAWGYDWLHDHLSEAERQTVRAVLLERTREQPASRHGPMWIPYFTGDSAATTTEAAATLGGRVRDGIERVGDGESRDAQAQHGHPESTPSVGVPAGQTVEARRPGCGVRQLCSHSK
jgi:hypothetical protein